MDDSSFSLSTTQPESPGLDPPHVSGQGPSDFMSLSFGFLSFLRASPEASASPAIG